MQNNIKEGDPAYWKHTQDFGIVSRVTVDSDDIYINIIWNDQAHNSEAHTYNTGDLTKDGQLIIGKLTKLFYEAKT